MSSRSIHRRWGLVVAAVVAVLACVGRRPAASVPCVARVAPPPPPKTDGNGSVVIHLRESPLMPEQYPYAIVVDGRLSATVTDSLEAARVNSAWDGALLTPDEIESINVFTGDSIPLRYRTRGLKRVYLITTCRARAGR